MVFEYNGLSNESGIYMITNTVNGKVYIGSCRSFKNRWNDHARILRSGRHHTKHLQASFNRHGEDAFIFTIVQHMPGSTKEERLTVEALWIEKYWGWKCYNGTKQTVSREGFPNKEPLPPKSEATRQKLSDTHKRLGTKPPSRLGVPVSEEDRQKKRESALRLGLKPPSPEVGHKHSEATLQKMREAAQKRTIHSMTGRTHSEETLKKMREAAAKRTVFSATGLKRSEETKRKMAEAHIGKKRSDEARKNMAEAQQRRRARDVT